MSKTIKRPDDPDHFMVLSPINKRAVARLPDGTLLAESSGAIRLMESAKTILDPVIYFPRGDLAVALTSEQDTTFCALKGDASYFSYKSDTLNEEKIAWSYETPVAFAQPIKGLIAFYQNRVILEEHPL